MTSRIQFLVAFFAGSAFAQLIAPGALVPRTSKPPVVFLNGYQQLCTGSNFAGTFGIADQVLLANDEVSLFFDNCSSPGKPAIEDLGASFGAFLANLKYDDGTPVDQVDVIAHSMGGLIVRSYLSGKQFAGAAFIPPAETRIRKVIFLATPHFGTGVALGLGLDAQLDELASGSRFLFDLATWNQGTDDLRGVDAIAAIGNGGSGRATMPGFDDGVVALTSGSLQFYLPDRTRVLPYCHVDGGGLISIVGYCSSNAKGIADIRSATQDTAQLIVSFLNGTVDWQSIGQGVADNPFLSSNGGLMVTMRSETDDNLPLDSASAQSSNGQSKTLNNPNHDVAYTDLFPAGPTTINTASGSTNLTGSLTLPAGVYAAVVAKGGPLIASARPAAASTFPLNVAPGEIIAIFGSNLAAETMTATGELLPRQLSDAEVLVNGNPIPLYYVSLNQINAIMPDDASGLVQLTVQNSSGKHTVNVLIAPTVPEILTLDASGSGPALARRAIDESVVTSDNPLQPGDYLVLFVTGLGATTNRDGIDYANVQPTVSIGGVDCPVSFAGRAPGYPGLDQINCAVPAGIAASAGVPVFVTSGGRTSNTATVAIQ